MRCSEVEDLLRALGFNSDFQPVDINPWLTLFDVRKQPVYEQSQRFSIDAWALPGITLVEGVALAIRLEQLGIAIDPAPAVEILLPLVSEDERFSGNESLIRWYDAMRHRGPPQVLRVEGTAISSRVERFKTAAGYKALLRLDDDGEPIALEVRPPKHRRRPDPVNTTCPTCGAEWLRGDPESSQAHRLEHARRVQMLIPKPNRRMVRLLDGDSDPELVTVRSPRWKHAEMYERARCFRREFGYDFVLWGCGRDEDPNARGFSLPTMTDRSAVLALFAGGSSKVTGNAGHCSGSGFAQHGGGEGSWRDVGRRFARDLATLSWSRQCPKPCRDF